MIERGTIEQINGRGRMTLRIGDRLVVADLHSGSGGCIGDLVEGEMAPGLRSWRNVGNSILSVVNVLAAHAVPDTLSPSDARPASERPAAKADPRHAPVSVLGDAPAQKSNRR